MSTSLDKVVYKPLFLADDPNDLGDDEEGDDDLHTIGEDQPFADPKLLSQINAGSHNNHQKGKQQVFGLSQLRILLYLVATLLFLAFVLQLLQSGDLNRLEATTAASLKSAAPSQPADTSKLLFQAPPDHRSFVEENVKVNNASDEEVRKQQQQKKSDNHQPGTQVPPRSSENEPTHHYDSYLSSVLNEHNHKVEAIEVDDLHFPFELGDHSKQQTIQWWKVGSRGAGEKYVTLTDYIRAIKSFNYNSSVTLTTQATTEFMHHALELCKRWDGPISVAVFAPGAEMSIAGTLIKFMRQCLPSPLSACIRDKITWHLVYTRSHGPQPSAITYPKFQLDSKNFPLFVNQDQCPKFQGPEPVDLIKQFHQELNKKNQLEVMNFRQKNQIPYPINVLRNTARQAATTKYILASDIELYPSINMVPLFMNYINRHDIRREFSGLLNATVDKFVFTLPIFEVDAKVEAPKTKQELAGLVERGEAIFFHKYVCDACQNFPNRLEWLHTDRFGLKNYRSSDKANDELIIFDITQRNKTRSEWEPIFIGTNEDPIYDDRLTWEGRRDKMGQMFEMCLKDYYLLIMGNAFLVHTPGIKRIDKKDVMKRLDYIRENNAIFETTMSSLRQQYATSKNINLC